MSEETTQVTEQRIAVVGEYKGHPTLSLPIGERYVFSFGLNKAKAILENLEAIKQFVETFDVPEVEETPESE